MFSLRKERNFFIPFSLRPIKAPLPNNRSMFHISRFLDAGASLQHSVKSFLTDCFTPAAWSAIFKLNLVTPYCIVF